MNRWTTVLAGLSVVFALACTKSEKPVSLDETTGAANARSAPESDSTKNWESTPGQTESFELGSRVPEAAVNRTGEDSPAEASTLVFEAPTSELDELTLRLRQDKDRQEMQELANRPLIPDGAQMEQQLNEMGRNFVEKLAAGDADAARSCFLSDEEVQRLFTPAFARLFASTRGSVNVKEWEKFGLSIAGGQQVEYLGCETVRPAIADPRERGLYQEPVLFISEITVDYRVTGVDRQLSVKHLVKIDDQWKFLQFQLIH